MKKKFIALGIAFLMLFSLAACNTDFDLADYKVTAKTEIANYATESNYCPDNWSLVCGIVDAGKQAVDAAENKIGVDIAVNDAKNAIDEVQNDIGAFYSLQKAFDNGWLTKEDLQSIAYYHNDDSMPVYPEPLNVDIAEKIGQDFVTYVNCQDAEHNIQIKYYGTYNGCVAAMIDGCQHYLDVEGSENIDGVVFHYGSSQRILIWRENGALEENEMVEQVKQSYVEIFLKTDHPEATIDDVTITEYLGTYNGAFVAVLNDQYNKFFIEEEIEVIIEGFYFTHSYGYSIRVWNNGNIYDLAGAYEQGFLTKGNLQTIAHLYHNKSEQHVL